ncbi:MAG: TIGR02444 family protein [Pseudomonadota bacterium]
MTSDADLSAPVVDDRPPASDADAPRPDGFWAWSNEIYEAKGVAATLLRLQDDAGLNVNILLWCLWCARTFEPAPASVIKSAHEDAAAWTADVAKHLRAARRALKNPPKHVDADRARALKKRVKKAELDAEEIEQTMLEALAEDGLAAAQNEAGGSARDRALANLSAYLDLVGAAADGDDRAGVAALVGLVFDAPAKGEA